MKKIALVIAALMCCALILGSCGSSLAYENKNFGIGFAPTSQFEMANADEIAGMETDGVVCDMMASDSKTGNAVIVSVEDDIYGGADAYLEAVKSALELYGYEIVYGEITSEKIAGKDFSVLTYSISGAELNANMATYAISENGELMLINATYTNDSELRAFVDCFVAID